MAEEHPPSPKREDDTYAFGRLTTSNLRFAGQARNDGQGVGDSQKRNTMAESRRKQLFPEVTDEQWNDWKWQVKNRIETLSNSRNM